MASSEAPNVTKVRTHIDTSKPSKQVGGVASHLASRIVGQPRAIDGLAHALEFDYAKPPLIFSGTPHAVKLFVGPPGVGKTETCYELARSWIGMMERTFMGEIIEPLTKIDCTEYTSEYAIANLKGSNKGLVGYNDDTPLMQNALDRYHFELELLERLTTYAKRRVAKAAKDKDAEKKTGELPELEMTMNDLRRMAMAVHRSIPFFKKVVLFDEVESAHPSLWHLLKSILNNKPIQFSNGSQTDFARSFIALTSNIGEKELQKVLKGGHLGFHRDVQDVDPSKVEQLIYETALREIERTFPPALVSRLREHIVVFRPIYGDDWKRILDVRLKDIRNLFRIMNPESRVPLHIHFTDEAKSLLLEKGISPRYGARKLNDVVKKHVLFMLARGSNLGAFQEEDTVVFELEKSPKPHLEMYVDRIVPAPK